MNRIIDKACLTVVGDPSVGIWPQEITLAGLDLHEEDYGEKDFKKMAEWLRSQLEKTFYEIYLDKIRVHFDEYDYPTKADLEAEARDMEKIYGRIKP